MKFLLVHNYYQQRGGEDQVFADEATLLESQGHEVLRYCMHNDAIQTMGRAAAARRTFWNSNVHRELRALIRSQRPVLMHCTNTFPLISPAAYDAAQREGVAVVQSLHNYRLLCPNAQFLRQGKVCEDCLGKLFAWPAVRHKCYRDSRAATAVLAGMLTAHRVLGTWRHKIDRYIALTEFARQKFASAGIPRDRIAVKPNFVSPDCGPGDGRGGYALFVGRLSAEKGIETLLSAWSPEMTVRLKIVGDGPLADRVRAAAAMNPAIEWLGQRPCDEVQSIMGGAAMLVFPSVWYEGFPKTIVESFCQGTPVVASDLGAMTEKIDHGRTGLLFPAGDSGALARAVVELTAQPQRLSAMRHESRIEFETHYTAALNYQHLVGIYADALNAQGNHAAAESLLATRPRTTPTPEFKTTHVLRASQQTCESTCRTAP